MHLIDWSLTKYDYWTFAFLVVAVIAFFYILIQLGGLPGKIAERRNHPHAEAVKIVGWIGLFTVFPWIHAIIWSIHDSMTVDIRSMPREGAQAEVEKPPVLSSMATSQTEPGRTPDAALQDDVSSKPSQTPGSNPDQTA